MPDLTDRVAIVTGGAQGIGKAIAEDLAGRGAQVMVGDIDSRRTETVDAISAEGGTASAREMDVTDRDAVDATVEEAVETFGRVDILVNNAGIFPPASLSAMTEESWERVLGVNLTGMWNCTSAVLPEMQEQSYGRIVNIASIAGGRIGWGPDLSHYAASKGGMVGFTRSAAIGLAPHGITINAILPGMIDTGAPEEVSSEEEIEAAVQMTPMGRMGDPKEIAFVVAMVCAQKAGFITGASIVVDGGYTLV